MKDQLQILLFIVSILTPLIGGLWFLWRQRKAAIQKNYQTLAREWMNEGDISSKESKYITLKLTLKNGDLYGTIESPLLKRDYEVHVSTGWFTSKLEVTELLGRNIVFKATAKIKITGNRNRIRWRATKIKDTDVIPTKTILWALDK